MTPEEQREFDEHYGDESDLLFDDDDEFDDQLAEALEGEDHLDEEGERDLITNQEHEEALAEGIDLAGRVQEEEEGQPEDEEQMDYYMRQHPDLLLALDIAAFRRQQMQ